MIMLALALQLVAAPAPAPMIRTPPAPAAGPSSVDLSQMPIEDAVELMFQLMSNDARDDMRTMLSDMDQQRKKKAAMREAAGDMAKEMQRLKALSRDAADAQSNPVAQNQIAWARQLPALCGSLTGDARERCLERAVRARTAELRAIPSRN